MWCRNCNIETNEKNCPICGQFTEEDTPVEIMWCGECNVPIIRVPFVAEKLATFPLIFVLCSLKSDDC